MNNIMDTIKSKKDEILIIGAIVSVLALAPAAIKAVSFYWSQMRNRM